MYEILCATAPLSYFQAATKFINISILINFLVLTYTNKHIEIFSLYSHLLIHLFNILIKCLRNNKMLEK